MSKRNVLRYLFLKHFSSQFCIYGDTCTEGGVKGTDTNRFLTVSAGPVVVRRSWEGFRCVRGII